MTTEQQQQRYVDALKRVLCRKVPDNSFEPTISAVRDAFKADEWIPPICRKLEETSQDTGHLVLIFAATAFVAGMEYAKGEGWTGE